MQEEMRMVGVGVSNRNQDPTHPPNPSDPAREPADPTSMTVGDGSLPPEPKNDGSVGGFSPQNPKKPPLNRDMEHFLAKLFRSGEISAKCMKSPPNLARSVYAQIQLQSGGFCSNKA